MGLNVRVISDVHLELPNPKPVDLLTCNDILVIAGDLGDPWSTLYAEFIEHCANAYRHVIVIAGNHEYYTKRSEHKILSLQSHMANVEAQITNVCSRFDNVKFLQREYIVIDDVLFLGCTLWSVPDPKVEHEMNDMYLIPGMNSDAYYRLHKQDRQWLVSTVKAIGWEYDYVVCVTHHLPSDEMTHPIYKDHHLGKFFSSNCHEALQYVNVAIAGHSHRHVDIEIQPFSEKAHKCRGVVNPVGYQQEYTGYDDTLVIKI